MRTALLVLVALLVAAAPARGGDAPYAEYDALLKTYVDAQGMVDYAAWKAKDEQALRRAVAAMAAQDPARMSALERKAYWINVYNAVTLQAILEFFPLDSIKDKQSILPGGYKVWDDYTFGPRELSLNQIEHELLRKMGDPRIHGAIVCASKGCPPLRAEAYVPEKLEEQLEAQSRTWLRDPARGLAVAEGVARVSKVFEWFGEDFPEGDQGKLRWIARYVEEPVAKQLRSGKLRLKTLDWDWSLNAQAK